MVLSRLDVDVAGALSNRMHNHVIDQVDNRASFGHRFDVLQINVQGLGLNFHRAVFDVGGHAVVQARPRPPAAAENPLTMG